MTDAVPTVSVIVPVYNGARFLAATLASVRAQTYRDFETVVVDDGSTDGSAEVAAGFGDVRVVRQANQGCAKARNEGVAAARGGLLAFLDADDLWTPDKLAVQTAHLAAHPAIGYSIARQEIFLEPGATRPPGLRPAHLEADQVGYLPSTLVVRREVFVRVGGFDTSLAVASDVEWFVRAKDLAIPMAILPQILVRRRIHRTNISSDVNRNHAALLRVFKASIDRQRGRSGGT